MLLPSVLLALSYNLSLSSFVALLMYVHVSASVVPDAQNNSFPNALRDELRRRFSKVQDATFTAKPSIGNVPAHYAPNPAPAKTYCRLPVL